MASVVSVMDKMEKAQVRMLFKHLFFATVLFNTPFVETTRFPRAATNMKVIYWNRAFFESLSIDVIMFVIFHELMHIILKHGLRRGARDPTIWNDACDYVINLRAKDNGFVLWEHCHYDPRFADMYEEQVYSILIQEQEQNGGAGDPGGGDEPGEPGDPSDINEDNPGQPSKRKGDGCGRDLVYNEVPSDPMERARIEQTIDANIAKAATVARQAGKMPAGMDILVEGIINPAQNWLALFIEYMTKLVQSEETWARRNRRIHRYVLPSRRNPGMGGVGVIGDTSGSMDEHKIWAQVSEEMQRMMEAANPEFIHAIWADDTEAAHEERFEPMDQIELHPKGNGGTDMRKPLAKMAEYDVDICVLVTDCYTPWPDEPTPFPLIVLSTTDQESPAWATRIRIR